MEPVLLVGALIVAVWLATRKKKTPQDDTEPGPIGEGDDVIKDPTKPAKETAPPDDSLAKKIADGAAKIGIVIEMPPKVEIPRKDLAPITPDPPQPGETPSNPIPSTGLYPGFRGYFLVMQGDTLIKIGNRLAVGWRDVRDDPENDWAVALCPKSVRDQYYGGQPAISLVQNYGKTPGVDCEAPGWRAELYFKKPLTGQYPVLGWKVP